MTPQGHHIAFSLVILMLVFILLFAQLAHTLVGLYFQYGWEYKPDIVLFAPSKFHAYMPIFVSYGATLPLV